MTPTPLEPPHTRPGLLDVNVLTALAWPNHEGHAAARQWFSTESAAGWATTPVTEIGSVRVSCNRRALPTATTPDRAVDMLRRLTALPGHRFWDDTIRFVTANYIDLTTITVYRQTTDAHLVALSHTHRGQLVTFDSAIRTLAGDDPGLVQLRTAS